jgi:hypothetical protein
MPGSVYVFNLYSEPISNLTIGGYPAGGINGYANGGSAPLYTPASLSVPRTKFPTGSAAFALGANQLQVLWDSFRGMTSVTIPADSVSLDDSLLLLLAMNEAILLNTRGYVLSSSPVQLATAMRVAGEPEPTGGATAG